MSTITEEATKGLQTWGNANANRDMDAVLDCYVDGKRYGQH